MSAQKITVYFATNRVVTNPSDPINGYTTKMVPPLMPQAMTYGTAFITGIDPATGAQGTVAEIAATRQGDFPPDAAGDLANPGRHLLLFIHGFDNSFSDAVTRAGYNAAWLAACGIPTAETTILAFSWPSIGRIFDIFPILHEDYLPDQRMADLSGPHLMGFLARLEPIIRAARAQKGMKITLLAHSMGNQILQSALENWFLSGNGDDLLFDNAILAAADCPFNGFEGPALARLQGLSRLSRKIHILYSHADQVLQLSMAVNLAQRLGQDGPHHRTDPARFDPATFQMTDCTAYRYDNFNFLTSHQYYRTSPEVRTLIANSL